MQMHMYTSLIIRLMHRGSKPLHRRHPSLSANACQAPDSGSFASCPPPLTFAHTHTQLRPKPEPIYSYIHIFIKSELPARLPLSCSCTARSLTISSVLLPVKCLVIVLSSSMCRDSMSAIRRVWLSATLLREVMPVGESDSSIGGSEYITYMQGKGDGQGEGIHS